MLYLFPHYKYFLVFVAVPFTGTAIALQPRVHLTDAGIKPAATNTILRHKNALNFVIFDWQLLRVFTLMFRKTAITFAFLKPLKTHGRPQNRRSFLTNLLLHCIAVIAMFIIQLQ